MPKLIYIVSQIIQNKSFEDSTRQSALEIIGSLAESVGPFLRKHADDLKQNFFPSLIHMLAQPIHEDSLEEWAQYVDEEL